MTNFALVAERLVTDKVLQAYNAMTSRTPASHGLLAAATLFALTGLCFLILAAYVWLNRHYQPDLAAALTGVLALGVASLIALVAGALLSFRRHRVKGLNLEAKKSVQDLLSALDDLFADPVREHPKTAALVATLAGLFVGGRHL